MSLLLHPRLAEMVSKIPAKVKAIAWPKEQTHVLLNR